MPLNKETKPNQTINKDRWFQPLLFIINNSVKYNSFVYIKLNEKTVLFLSNQFSRSQQR